MFNINPGPQASKRNVFFLKTIFSFFLKHDKDYHQQFYFFIIIDFDEKGNVFLEAGISHIEMYKNLTD